MSKARDIMRDHELARERDDWRREKRIALAEAMPNLVDRKPVAESNVQGEHFFRNFKSEFSK